MKYINAQYQNNPKETIDNAETFKDAKYLVNEYRAAYGIGWSIWISQRQCN